MATITELPGLRERKAAQLKMRLVELLIDATDTTQFHELTVEMLCEQAMISKVTFFKYFPTKDALLWFHASVWIYQLKADCLLAGRTGIEALRHYFTTTATQYNSHPNLFALFFSVNTQQLMGMERPELSVAEKLYLYPDGSTLDSEINLSIGDFLLEHCRHARRNGEFRIDVALRKQVSVIGSLWHGSGFVGMRLDPERPGDNYITTFNTIIKLLAP